MSGDDKVDRVVRDLKVDSGNADLGSLSDGRWFARIRGIDAQGHEGFDTVKLIEVKEGHWRVSYSTISLTSGQTVLSWIGQQANGQPLTGSNDSAVIARDEALTQVVATADKEVAGRGPRLSWGDLKPGVYFLCLSGKSGQGGTLNSATYHFEIPANWGLNVFDVMSSLQHVK